MLLNIKNVLVIVNPYSGKKKIKNYLLDIINNLCEIGCRVNIHTTLSKGDALTFTANNVEGHDLVICCGGDGTLNEVINGMMMSKSSVPLGYIPLGTTNDFAKSLKLPLKVKKAAKNIVEGDVHVFDLGTFNNKYFSYIASFGAFTKVSYSTPQRLKNTFGHSAYILEGMKELSAIKPFKMKIKYDGNVLEDEFIFGCVSNSASIAGIFKLDKSLVDFNDGNFEVILVKDPKGIYGLGKLFKDFMSSKFNSDKITFLHASDIEFICEEPLTWTLDGEFGGKTENAQIKNIRSALSLITK